jgi:hypothetical protein
MPLMTTLTTVSAQKSFGSPYIIPANSVIIMDGTYTSAIGTWDLYTDALDKLIVGTIDQGNVGVSFASSGQSSSTAGTIGTGGSHYGNGVPVGGGGGNINGYRYDAPAGDHNHNGTWDVNSLTANNDIKPVHTTFTMMRTSANTTTFPANTLHISETNIYSGTQQLATSSNRYIAGSNTRVNNAVTSHSMMHTVSTDAAAHNHYNDAFRQRVTPNVSGPLNQIYSFYDYNPAHNHTLTKTVSISNLRGKLLKIWLAASPSIPKSSVVIMYCGNLSVLPSYWKVCDGTNGTVDMQNYFLGYATSSGTAHNTTTAANTQYTLTNPSDTASNDWTHAHYNLSYAYQTQQYVYHSLGVHSHTHAVSGGSLTSNYEPAHLKLAFIQLIPT